VLIHPKAGLSSAELLAISPKAERDALIRRLGSQAARAYLDDWRKWERPGQAPPPGDWRTWLVMAGRGFGKTRMGAEWVRALAERRRPIRIALIGATLAEARAVMVEGESGLLAIAPPGLRPEWEPSLRRLRWPGGATAFLYSAAEPDGLRGPQHDCAWADEIAKWPHGPEAWDMMMMGLRLSIWTGRMRCRLSTMWTSRSRWGARRA